jgi:hypothetical protein
VAQQSHLVGPQLPAHDAITAHRLLGDDALDGSLVCCLEDHHASVDRAEEGPDTVSAPFASRRRSHWACAATAACSWSVMSPRRVPRRMQEVDPLGHAPSILAAHDLVERLRRSRPRIETPLALPSDSLSEDNWSDVGGMA